MPLTKYTQADFAALERAEDGYIHVPEGSWSGVDFGSAYKLHIAAGSFLGSYCELGNWCKLDNGCELGNWCKLGNGLMLGDGCVLGVSCELGNGCMLGDRCMLGKGCRLGNGCRLGDMCLLDNSCTLGNYCVLGNGCMLGDGCKLGTKCMLGNGCSMEGGRVQNATYYIVTNIGSRNDSAYAYCNTKTDEIYVRAGCWFGSIDEFVARVHEVHAGTQHETDYIAFAEFARARFRRYKGVRVCRAKV